MKRDFEFFNDPKVDWFVSNCQHDIYGCPNSICIGNNDDTWYKEVFRTREEAEEFVKQFQEMIELAFPLN